jgi:hypothetical protein
MCLADWVVVLREIDGGVLSVQRELAIAPDPEDCPARWARKVRFLAEVGASERARAAILQRPAEALERLPRDRDYLGALAHLVPPVIATGCLAHAEVLSALLAPHAELYAADFRLHADGSIAHFLGLLARELGRTHEAEQYFEQAVERNQRAFPARAAHSFHELGRLLPQGSPRARAAFGGALELGRRLGLPELTRRAERALASA